MKFHLILLCILRCVYFGNSFQNSTVVSNGIKWKSLPAVDALIESLENQQNIWEQNDRPCLRDTLEMLRGVKSDDLWAVWVWDSMQLPAGSLYGLRYHPGNYDQCLEAPWISPGRSQYCLVDVKSENVEKTRSFNPFDKAAKYFKNPNKARVFNDQTIGVCLPASCNTSSVGRIYKHIHQLTHLPDGHVTVDPRDCQTAGVVEEFSTGFFVFWSMIATLFSIALYSTLRKNDGTTHSTLDVITDSFNMKMNYGSLFKVNKDETVVLNGMRFFNAAVVVGIHEVFYTILNPISNKMATDQMLRSSLVGLAMCHFDIIVDTYFAISGLLLVRSFMIGKQKNILKILLKRYLRLIGPFAISIMYIVTGAAVSSGRGPLWRRLNRNDAKYCEANWWRSLLMMNNACNTVCHYVTWHVSSDFRLTVLGVILLYFFRKNKQLGVLAFIVTAIGINLKLALGVYSKQMDFLPFREFFTTDNRDNAVLEYIYLSSLSHAGSYYIGMIMGYIITIYKPADYRNIISKKWSVIIIVGSLSTMLTMLIIGWLFLGRPYDPLEAAIVVITNRVFWAIGVCCIIGACEYGNVSLVSGLLGWRGFIPLSKLSYGVYIVHSFFLLRQKYLERYAMTFDIYVSIVVTLGCLAASCVVSFVMYLIVEGPLINMSNALFREKSEPKPDQQVKTEVTERNGTCGNGEKYYQNGYMHAKSKVL